MIAAPITSGQHQKEMIQLYSVDLGVMCATLHAVMPTMCAHNK